MSAGVLFSQLLPVAIVGTILLGFVLPLRQVFGSARRDRDDLRSIYGGKRKHDEKFKNAAFRVSDYGELEEVGETVEGSRVAWAKRD